MKNHWIREKRKRDQSTKYSVQLYCLDHFGNVQYLVALPWMDKVEWEAQFECDIDGYHIMNERGLIVFKETFMCKLHMDKGYLIQLNNLFGLNLP